MRGRRGRAGRAGASQTLFERLLLYGPGDPARRSRSRVCVEAQVPVRTRLLLSVSGLAFGIHALAGTHPAFAQAADGPEGRPLPQIVVRAPPQAPKARPKSEIKRQAPPRRAERPPAPAPAAAPTPAPRSEPGTGTIDPPR